jgi:hypothetical protein
VWKTWSILLLCRPLERTATRSDCNKIDTKEVRSKSHNINTTPAQFLSARGLSEKEDNSVAAESGTTCGRLPVLLLQKISVSDELQVSGRATGVVECTEAEQPPG